MSGVEGSAGPEAWPPWDLDAGPHRSRSWLRRTVVAIGFVGVAVCGYVAVTSGADSMPASAPTVTATAAADEWAARAARSVTSLEQQLAEIAQAQQAARSKRPPGPDPAALRVLEERSGLLQQRKATLWSQLDTYRLLDRTRADLVRTEAELLAVEMELQGAPPPSSRSPEQAAAVAALEQQRDQRLRQRDTQHQLVLSLEGSVASAVRTPLPE